LRCASQSTAAPVRSTNPHTPSTRFARKLSHPALGAEIGAASKVGKVICCQRKFGDGHGPRRSHRPSSDPSSERPDAGEALYTRNELPSVAASPVKLQTAQGSFHEFPRQRTADQVPSHSRRLLP